MVCAATGGPQKYTGKDMKESHKNMKITEKEWIHSVKLLKATLDKFSVPVKEQNEVVNIVQSLKADIVTQWNKFGLEYLDLNTKFIQII